MLAPDLANQEWPLKRRLIRAERSWPASSLGSNNPAAKTREVEGKIENEDSARRLVCMKCGAMSLLAQSCVSTVTHRFEKMRLNIWKWCDVGL